MTKVWILTENPFDEGSTIHGVFSTEEKANNAYDIFSKVSRYELYLESYELDNLEKFIPEALEGYQWYSGWKSRWVWADGSIHYNDWDLSPTSIDSLFSETNKENQVMVRDSSVWAFIKAHSVEEATEIAEKILQEKGQGYLEWLK